MDHQSMYTDRHVIEMLAMKHRILFQAAICLKLKRDFFFVSFNDRSFIKKKMWEEHSLSDVCLPFRTFL